MGQPVKLSDELVNEARIAGATMQRSIAGQVEFWASLGKAMEAVMTGDDIHRTRKVSTARSLSESLETVNQPLGRARLAAYLDSRPFPRFIADPVEPRVFIRQDADGTQTRGRVVGRTFQPLVDEHELLPR
jgi:hypothetical protein